MVALYPYPRKAEPLGGEGFLQDGAIRGSPRICKAQSPSLPMAQRLDLSFFRMGL